MSREEVAGMMPPPTWMSEASWEWNTSSRFTKGLIYTVEFSDDPVKAKDLGMLGIDEGTP